MFWAPLGLTLAVLALSAQSLSEPSDSPTEVDSAEAAANSSHFAAISGKAAALAPPKTFVVNLASIMAWVRYRFSGILRVEFGLVGQRRLCFLQKRSLRRACERAPVSLSARVLPGSLACSHGAQAIAHSSRRTPTAGIQESSPRESHRSR